MSLIERMRAIVGDQNNVARYLAEKIGHTALFAWAIVAVALAILLPEPLRTIVGHIFVGAALVANCTYVTYGKVRIYRESGAFDARDYAFDTWVGAAPAAIATVLYGWIVGPVVVAVWFGVFCILDNNALGKPS